VGGEEVLELRLPAGFEPSLEASVFVLLISADVLLATSAGSDMLSVKGADSVIELEYDFSGWVERCWMTPTPAVWLYVVHDDLETSKHLGLTRDLYVYRPCSSEKHALSRDV
jgi:hypothetical protein